MSRKLEFDWTEASPEMREVIDRFFAKTNLCKKSDNVACGWFTIEVEDDKEARDVLHSFAQTLEEAADSL